MPHEPPRHEPPRPRSCPFRAWFPSVFVLDSGPFGPLKNPKNRTLPDLNTREIIALALLVVMIFVIGLFPSTFLSRSSDAVSSFDTRNRQVWIASQELGDGPAKMLTNEDLATEAGGVDKGLLEKLERMDKGAPAPKAEEASK